MILSLPAYLYIADAEVANTPKKTFILVLIINLKKCVVLMWQSHIFIIAKQPVFVMLNFFLVSWQVAPLGRPDQASPPVQSIQLVD